MKTKFKALFCLVVAFSLSSVIFAATQCECGSLSSGITIYSVNGNNEDCCESQALDDAYITTYAHQGGGVYTQTGTTETTGHLAQDSCCRPT